MQYSSRGDFKFKVITKHGKHEVKKSKLDFYQLEHHLRSKPMLAKELDEMNKSVLDQNPEEMDAATMYGSLEIVEHFLKQISEDPIFWTREVLTFFGIKKPAHQKPLL